MFLLAHIGITMAAGKAGVWVLERVQDTRPAQSIKNSEPMAAGFERAFFRIIDFRFLILGSILPDLIDKPLGMVILRQLANGRIFAHTLLFALILLLNAVLLPRLARPAAFALFTGDIIHLVLDSMWQSPGTLLWPIYGIDFPQGVPMSVANTIFMYAKAFLTNRSIQVAEAIGAFFIVVIIISLLFDRRMKKFLFLGEL